MGAASICSRGPGSLAPASIDKSVQRGEVTQGWVTGRAFLAAGDRMLCSTLKNLLHFFLLFFLMPLYPLASAVARLGGRGC